MNIEKEWLNLLYRKFHLYNISQYFGLNPNLNWNNIKYLEHNWTYDNYYLSMNENITYDIVKNNTNIKWHYGVFSHNPSILWNDFINDKYHGWVTNAFGYHKSVTFDIILNNLDILDVRFFSSNPNLVLQNVLDYPHFNWDFYEISKHPNITFEMIIQNKYLKWNYNGIFQNPNLSWDIICEYEKKIKWNYNILSLNSIITWDIVKNNLNKKWSFKYLSSNKNITWDIIINNPEYKWDLIEFLENPNLTLFSLEYIMNKIGYDNIPYRTKRMICRNSFNKDKEEFIKNIKNEFPNMFD